MDDCSIFSWKAAGSAAGIALCLRTSCCHPLLQIPYNKSMLKCPICQEDLKQDGRSWKCVNRHSFDQAKEGYLNLSRKQKSDSGDNKLMVQARTAFLETGAYAFLKDEISRLLDEKKPEVLIDLGCGQGYYTKDFALKAEQSYGMDLSKEAIRHAAKHDHKTQYLVGSIFSLPFPDESADVLTSIFTPIPAEEAARVLKKDGWFITAMPGRMHHAELKEAMYENVRLNEDPKAPEGFELVEQKELSEKKHVDDVMALLEMTPYRFKSPLESVEKIRNMKEGLDVTFDFIVSVWRKKA